MSDKVNFEDALKEFEEILERLEDRDITIDEAIKLHEKGLKQAKICEDILKKHNEKIEVYKKKQEKENV